LVPGFVFLFFFLLPFLVPSGFLSVPADFPFEVVFPHSFQSFFLRDFFFFLCPCFSTTPPDRLEADVGDGFLLLSSHLQFHIHLISFFPWLSDPLFIPDPRF